MLSNEEQEKISEAIFMIAFHTALEQLRAKGVSPDARLTGMIRSMTTVIRLVFKEMEKD